MTKSSLLLLAIIFYPASSKAEPIDVSIAKVKTDSSAGIYVTQTLYKLESAKAAYVTSEVYRTYVEAQVNPSIPREQIQSMVDAARDRAIERVQGTSLRGGYLEAITKDSANTAFGLVKIDASNTVDLAVRDVLDLASTKGNTPEMNTHTKQLFNTFLLEKAGGNDILGKSLKDVGALFYPDVIHGQDLELTPEVKNARFEKAAREGFSSLHAGLEKLNRGQLSKDQLDKIVSDRISEQTEALRASIEKALKAPPPDRAAQALAERRRLEAQYQDLRSTVGSLSALAAYAGDPAAARQISKVGNALIAGAEAVTAYATFALDPIGSIKSFMGAGAAFGALFGKEADDGSAARHQQIIDELHSIKKLIGQLAESMDARFNGVDTLLRQQHRETTQRLQQIDGLAQRNEENQRYFSRALERLSAQTYSSSILSGGLSWIQTTGRCFPKGGKRLSEDALRICRDELALHTLAGPVAGDQSRFKRAPLVIGEVAERLAQRIALPPVEVPVNPSAWLAGTQLLSQLKRSQPGFDGILNETTYGRQGFVNVDQVRNAGEYLRAVFRNMALLDADSGRPRLRRELIETYLRDYEVAVRKAFGSGMVSARSVFRNAPNPVVDFDKQSVLPKDEQAVQAFWMLGTPSCSTNTHVTTGQYVNDDLTQWVPFRFNREDYDKYSSTVIWPKEIFQYLPPAVRLAATSGFADPEHGSLKLGICLLSGIFYNNMSGVKPPADVKSFEYAEILGAPIYSWNSLRLDFKVTASYLKAGQVKTVPVAYFRAKEKFGKHNATPRPGKTQIDPYTNGPLEGNGSAKEISVFNDLSKLEFTPADGAVGIKTFEADFRELLDEARDQARSDFDTQLKPLNDASAQARESLAFLLGEGLGNSSPAVELLKQAVNSLGNLPDARAWAEDQFNSGKSDEEMKILLKDRTNGIRDLLGEIEKEETLRPGEDLFGKRLKELSASAASTDSAERDSDTGSRSRRIRRR